MQRNRKYTPIVLAAVLLVAGALRAHAVWLKSQITPKSAVSTNFAFTVKTSDRDGLTQFDVTARAVGKKVLPFAHAYLDIIDADGYVASVPVASLDSERTDRKAVFYFRVSQKSILRSKFEFRAQGYQLMQTVNGQDVNAPKQPQYEQTLGGEAYWFYLRDFVEPAKH